ncbi:MAG: hypothetical protein BroJett025_01700 [Patescibacteria group bacterium]|nr:MAG: hypothetical protein BroJett025_01700 [Patescibacteria group bacterium]
MKGFFYASTHESEQKKQLLILKDTYEKKFTRGIAHKNCVPRTKGYFITTAGISIDYSVCGNGADD